VAHAAVDVGAEPAAEAERAQAVAADGELCV